MKVLIVLFMLLCGVCLQAKTITQIQMFEVFDNLSHLQSSINNWLRYNSEYEVIDIKYQTPNSQEYRAMIIYKKEID